VIHGLVAPGSVETSDDLVGRVVAEGQRTSGRMPAEILVDRLPDEGGERRPATTRLVLELPV